MIKVKVPLSILAKFVCSECQFKISTYIFSRGDELTFCEECEVKFKKEMEKEMSEDCHDSNNVEPNHNHKKMIELMGREPINPVGSCFDSTGGQLFFWLDELPIKICHGIGITNVPGQEGRKMAHAWLERDGFAFDTTWGVKCRTEKYRSDLKLSHVVEYSIVDFLRIWTETDFPGPWDERIKMIISENEKGTK